MPLKNDDISTNSLFGEHLTDSDQDLLNHLDEEALHDKHYWPGDLLELSEVIHAQLKREGVEDENCYRQIERVLLAMSFLCGGRNYYLPKGERIKNALRNKRVYDEFTGRNVRELASRYHLSEVKIYQILREQRQLLRDRVQPGLFPG